MYQVLIYLVKNLTQLYSLSDHQSKMLYLLLSWYNKEDQAFLSSEVYDKLEKSLKCSRSSLKKSMKALEDKTLVIPYAVRGKYYFNPIIFPEDKTPREYRQVKIELKMNSSASTITFKID